MAEKKLFMFDQPGGENIDLAPATGTTLPKIEVTENPMVHESVQNTGFDNVIGIPQRERVEPSDSILTYDQSLRTDDQAMKSSQDIIKSLDIAAKEVIPGYRDIKEGRELFPDFDDEPNFDHNSPEAHQIYSELGAEHFEELNEAKSLPEMMNIRDQITSAQADMEYMTTNHGLAGSMGLYMVASLADPVSYLAYGGLGKFYQVAKIADKLSKAGRGGRAGITAGAAATIEGGSEFYIQSHGAREYEAVGATMLFAGILGGGGHMMVETLQRSHTTRKQEAFDKLTEGGVTLKSDPVQAKNLLDEALVNDSLSVYRSKLASGLSKLLPQRLQFSPGMIAWQRGGSISALAHLFDTLPGLSTKGDFTYKQGDNHIFEPKLKDGRTAMDVKYEAMEDFVQYEYARVKSFEKHVKDATARGENPMTKQEFSSAVWREVNANFLRYQTKKMSVMAEVEADEILVEELRAGLNEKLVNDADYLKLEGQKAQEEYRDKQLKKEIDAVARDRMVDEPEYQAVGNNEAVKDMVEASNTYYSNMKRRLESSGIKGAEYYDPRFHMPRMYNKDAVVADKAGAKVAMQKAIEESAEYKYELSKARAELDEAIFSSNKPKSKELSEEIRRLEGEIEFATQEIDNLEKILTDPQIPESLKAKVLNQRVHLTKDIADGKTRMRLHKDGEAVIVEYATVTGEMRYLASHRGKTWSATKKDFDDAVGEPLSREKIKDVFDTIDGHRQENEPAIRAEIKKIIDSTPAITDLMKATGKTVDDIISAETNKAYSSITGRVGISANTIDSQVVIHELLHSLTTEALATNKTFYDQMRSLRDEVIRGYWDENGLKGVLDSNGISLDLPIGKGPIDVGDETVPHIFDDGTTLGKRVQYMLGLNKEGVPKNELLGEFIAVGLSNPILAKVLNEVKVKSPATGKKVSILSRMKDALKGYLGIERINKSSVLGKMFDTIENNAKSSQVGHLKSKKKYMDLESDIKAKERELESLEFRDTKDLTELGKVVSERKKVRGEIDELSEKSLAARNEIVAEIQAKRDAMKATMSESIVAMKARQKEAADELSKNVKSKAAAWRKVKAYPKQAAGQSIENISKQNTLEQFNLASNTPSVLKGRVLNLDPRHMQNYMQTDEASISQAYHYGTSGRLAVGHATGFTDPKKFRNYLEENSNFNKEDMRVAMDLFELTLGTRQIPTDAGSNWEKGIRMMKSFNYVTMGGQFAKYGMSEIGAGVYAGGFNYLKELIPAMKTTKKLYKGQDLTQVEEDVIRMAEASEIWQNNARTKYADIDNIESTFAKGAEEKLNWMSQAMFRISGLEGISTLTKVALPRAFMGRIIKQAAEGRSSYDLIRWGIGPEDMAKIAEQPIIKNEKGQITDFNFQKWDQEVAEKFQIATTRMSRDGILRPDAIRIPNWMNDGGQSWIWRLASQFMSFAAMANERLFLRGLSENRRMALIGAMTSMGILAAFEKASEEVAVSLGLLDEDRQRYDLDSEDGVENLMKSVATRASFVGAPHFLAEQLINYNSFNGGERVLSQAGGPTAGRAQVMAKAIAEFGWDGKVGTAAQVHTIKSAVPFSNLVGVDSFVKNMAGEVRETAREEDYYR